MRKWVWSELQEIFITWRGGRGNLKIFRLPGWVWSWRIWADEGGVLTSEEEGILPQKWWSQQLGMRQRGEANLGAVWPFPGDYCFVNYVLVLLLPSTCGLEQNRVMRVQLRSCLIIIIIMLIIQLSNLPTSTSSRVDRGTVILKLFY
mgnify:CR=1 FL=1